VQYVRVRTGKHVLAEVTSVQRTLSYTVRKISPIIFYKRCATKNNLLFEIGTGCLIRSRKHNNEYHISYFFKHFFETSAIYALTIGTGNCLRHIWKSHINGILRTKIDTSCRRRIHCGVGCLQEDVVRAVTEYLW